MSKVHAIEISSRHEDPHEIASMTAFANAVHAAGLSDAIESVFYDSKNSYCTFMFKSESPDFKTEGMKAIHQIARKHIAQFEWDGWMDHGGEEPQQPDQG